MKETSSYTELYGEGLNPPLPLPKGGRKDPPRPIPANAPTRSLSLFREGDYYWLS